MERILIVNNRDFFNKYNIINITKSNEIPKKNCILFFGFYHRNMNNSHFRKLKLKKYISMIKEEKEYKYILIIGKTDLLIKNQDFIQNIPDNIQRIYANNINYKHPKIKFFPMGSDFRSIDSFSKADINNKTRNILCYCNFSLTTHSDRRIIYKNLKNKKCINFENMGVFMNYSISRDTFFERIGNSKFVICPRGNAIDTFRFYDTIYAGAIPIIVKENYHDEEYFEEIPILFLKNKNEFKKINKEFLEKKYEELKPKLKNFYKKFDFNYFMEKITPINNK